MNAVGHLDSKSSLKVTDKQNLVERISVVSEKVGDLLAAGGLAVVIGWIGLLKFTPAEASAIEPFARHSPLSGWAFNYLSVQQFSNVVGLTELNCSAIAPLPVSFPWWIESWVISPRQSDL